MPTLLALIETLGVEVVRELLGDALSAGKLPAEHEPRVRDYLAQQLPTEADAARLRASER